MFYQKKNSNKYHNYILVSEKDSGIKQYHFSKKKVLGFFVLSVVVLSSVLFLSANFLSNFIYKNKISNLRSNYENLTNTIVSLEKELDELTAEMTGIEDKDKAIRTYAGLPQIDNDIRKLGVGGGTIIGNSSYKNIPNDLLQRISEIELDVNNMSRKVKLELNSYSNLYDLVKEHSDNLKTTPSILPVQSGYVNSNFGYREDPFDGKVRFHHGLDIAVNIGTKVYAPADGKVKFVGRQGGWGKVLKIDHGNGYRTVYAHLSRIVVKPGSEIKRGDLVAESGNSGRSSGPHLHYEVHKYGAPQNPMDYFSLAHLSNAFHSVTLFFIFN